MIFHISDLIPLEDEPRDYSLRFLTQVWRNFGTFSVIKRTPVYVRNINGVGYLEDGNHRCLWSLINGIDTIEGVEENPDEDGIKSTILTVGSARRRGVFSIHDLLEKILSPAQYFYDGPITHRITEEDLANPNYYLRI